MARRSLMWTPDNRNLTITASVQILATNLLINSFVTGSQSKCTVTRMVGRVYYHSDSSTAESRVLMGIGVFSDLIAAASVPDLRTDPHDWLYYTYLAEIGGSREVATDTFQKNFKMIEFDVRSQRKMAPNEALFPVFHELSGQAMSVQYAIRTLIRLP